MKTAQRQNPQRFSPVVGEVYENAGGGRFICRSSNGNNGRMQNILSGWDCTAHGIVRYEDGTIEWDYSTDGHFRTLDDHMTERIRKAQLRHRQFSIMNAMLCLI